MADFNFHLNRQGPVGKKGEKGEKGKDGNTPIFSEGTNTATEYTLLIDYGDGNIGQTGNLRPPVTNEGGTYVRYNTQTGTYEINEADIADLNRTQGEVTLASVQDVINETALDTDAVSFELRNQDLEDINEDIEALDEKVDGIDDRLDTAEDNTSQAQQDIVNLDNRVESLDGRVTTNEGAIEQAQSDITALQTGKANVVHTHTISQITDAGALASQNVVDYQSQVINKPTIPTVGDGTITITQGGVTKGTFTTNQSGNSTIALDAGGGGVNFETGTGLELTQQNVLNVKIDGTTITTNASGELVANSSGGTTYTAGNGIDLTNDEISVKYDNNTLKLNGSGQLYADIPTATTSNLGLVKPDGTSITVDSNGVISAVSSAPSNMVTTNTNQTITGQKKFTDYTTFYGEYGPVITSNMNDVNAGRGIRFSSQSIRLRGNGYSTGIYLSSYGNLGQNAYDFSILQSNNITYFNQDSYISDKRIFRNNTSSNFLLEKDMLDGTTVSYDSTSGKISAVSSVNTDNTTIVSNNNVLSAVGLNLGKGLASNCTIVGSGVTYDGATNTLVGTQSSGVAAGLTIDLGVDSNKTTIITDVKIDSANSTDTVFAVKNLDGTNEFHLLSNGNGYVNGSNLGSSGIFNDPNSDGICRIKIVVYPGNAQIITHKWMWDINQWTQTATFGIGVSTWYHNSISLGNSYSTSTGNFQGTFYLDNFSLEVRNSSTDIYSNVYITSNALITGIDTNYLAIDSQGRLTLSAAVIAKLNQIT